MAEPVVVRVGDPERLLRLRGDIWARAGDQAGPLLDMASTAAAVSGQSVGYWLAAIRHDLTQGDRPAVVMARLDAVIRRARGQG